MDPRILQMVWERCSRRLVAIVQSVGKEEDMKKGHLDSVLIDTLTHFKSRFKEAPSLFFPQANVAL